MSYQISIENDGRGVLVSWTGDVSGDEILIANEAVYARDKKNRFRYQIWDFSSATSFNMTEDELRTIAFQDQRVARHNPDQIVAIVGTDTFFSGANRRYSIYASVWSGFETKSFHDVAKARSWVSDLTGLDV